MISLEEVQRRILDAVAPRPPVEVRLRDACGLVLASDVVSPEPVARR